MRLAWFTPLPPVRSGISAYNAELLPRLAGDARIEVFVDSIDEVAAPAGTTVRSAHDFVWRHHTAPYDLIVYQLGNATCHDFMWPYMLRYPGLVVLHDGQLHHARARRLLQRERRDDYRAEFAYNHPTARPGAAEFAVAGQTGAPYYFWPMLRLVVERARMVAVHNARLGADLAERHPGTAVVSIAMGVPDPTSGEPSERATRAARAAVRSRYGIPETDALVTTFGLVTPEKRVVQTLRALATVPDAHLVLVGDTVRHLSVRKEAAALGLTSRVHPTGFVSDAAVREHLLAADVCVCLRWPTSRETSASWLRCLAAARATIVTDLEDAVDVPTLDPRTWVVQHASADPGASSPRPSAPAPVAVAVDILDEEHSLALALRRLLADAALRGPIEQAARRWWRDHHTLDRMVDDYRALLGRAMRAAPPPRRDLPAHVLADGTGTTRRLLSAFDVADVFS